MKSGLFSFYIFSLLMKSESLKEKVEKQIFGIVDEVKLKAPAEAGSEKPADRGDEDDDENIDDAAALARANRTPNGGDDDDDDDDKRGGAESDGGLGDDEDDDEKGLESSNKRKKIGASPDGNYFFTLDKN